jgi:asparagine synthase (glutamine-hydrolysing)
VCGIAGHIGPEPVSEARAQACLALMRRRGPDAAGTYRYADGNDRHVLLLHSRLSIIDLDERSNQPLREGGHILVFNGEIYNYVELRRELEAGASPPFATTSDSEVLLRLLARDGWGGLASCEGMWGLAFYDETAGRLTLSRDRFGEKPLYLCRDITGLYFGSEAKFIFALMDRRLPIDVAQVIRFLVNGYKSLYKGRSTFFRGLEELRPGTAMVIECDGCSMNRYWTAERTRPDERISYQDAVAAAKCALIRSVELRLRADVPLAFCLSGGVDSNALIAVAKRVFGYDVHGFTIMNRDSRYEERDMVEHAVRDLELRHTAIAIDTTGFLDQLRALVRQHDAPVYTITYYVQWLLMRAISAAGYRVSVSGTGADELFSGYFDHHNAYLYEVATDPAQHREALADWQEHVAPIVRNPFLQDPDVFRKDPAQRGHIFLNADEFSAYLVAPWAELFHEESYADGLLRNRMLNELFHESVPPILHEDDLNAMYFSIENRSPFLDRALFETCQSIPTRHLVRRGRAKAVLRDAVRGIAPEAVLDNPRKVGFNAPILDLLDTRDPTVRDWLLDDGPIYELVRRDSIAALIDKPWLANSASKYLFSLVASKIFLEEMQ